MGKSTKRTSLTVAVLLPVLYSIVYDTQSVATSFHEEVLSLGDNVILNGSFEYGFLGWSSLIDVGKALSGERDFRRSITHSCVKDGKSAMEIRTTHHIPGMYNEVDGLIPGNSYRLSFSVRGKSGHVSTFQLLTNDNQWHIYEDIAVTKEWATYSLDFIAPQSLVHMYVYAKPTRNTKETIIFFDNIEIRIIQPARTIRNLKTQARKPSLGNNLLVNGSFEEGFHNWSGLHDCSAQASGDAVFGRRIVHDCVKDGTSALEIWTRNHTPGMFSSIKGLTRGSRYRLSFGVFGKSGTIVQYQLVNTEREWYLPKLIPVAHGWRVHSTDFVAPATSVRLYLYGLPTIGTEKTSTLFDDIDIREIE